MKNKYLDILIRYLLLILIAIPNLYLFYILLTPLTTYFIYFILTIFFEVSLNQNILQINNYSIEIIKACVAGSAYYLLAILNISIPNIKILQRIKMILFSFLTLFLINIFRIFILICFSLYSIDLFNLTHKLFWYFMSIIFVVFIWFIEVKIFKIKQIPIYSDIKILSKLIKN